MAVRARLTAPRIERKEWPWHQAKWVALPASLFMKGERRMEAETYLASGYGIRIALEAVEGHIRLGALASVWQPSRLKGIQASPKYGTPFLAATQVFDFRPTPRKWLAIERTENANERFVKSGTILVTCSGNVGRSTVAYEPHEGALISHDLLRIQPKQKKWWGWIYAFLRSPQARAMMTAAQYGHVVKHLEVSHLNALPIPLPKESLLEKFTDSVNKVLEYRRRAYTLTIQAEDTYLKCFPSLANTPYPSGFEVSASKLFHKRRRLEASYHLPFLAGIVEAYLRNARKVELLSRVVERVFVPGRFKHVYGEEGTPYLDSADILEVNPDIGKYVLSLSPEEQEEYHVEPGWLLIPCSGQVYGNIGHVAMATNWHVGKVLTNHIMRVVPKSNIRSGYLQCVLGHPQLGRPLLVSLAFGSSVPEIAAEDVASIPIPRLDAAIESHLAAMMEEAASIRSKADELEDELTKQADELIRKFMAGNTSEFTTLDLAR